MTIHFNDLLGHTDSQHEDGLANSNNTQGAASQLHAPNGLDGHSVQHGLATAELNHGLVHNEHLVNAGTHLHSPGIQVFHSDPLSSHITPPPEHNHAAISFTGSHEHQDAVKAEEAKKLAHQQEQKAYEMKLAKHDQEWADYRAKQAQHDLDNAEYYAKNGHHDTAASHLNSASDHLKSASSWKNSADAHKK